MRTASRPKARPSTAIIAGRSEALFGRITSTGDGSSSRRACACDARHGKPQTGPAPAPPKRPHRPDDSRDSYCHRPPSMQQPWPWSAHDGPDNYSGAGHLSRMIWQERAQSREMPQGGRDGGQDRRMRAVGPKTAELLNILARSLEAPTILELGTSFGYSGIWLAEAARATGGRLITMELHEYKSVFARDMAEKAGLAENIEFRIGDAVQIPRTQGWNSTSFWSISGRTFTFRALRRSIRNSMPARSSWQTTSGQTART